MEVHIAIWIKSKITKRRSRGKVQFVSFIGLSIVQ